MRMQRTWIGTLAIVTAGAGVLGLSCKENSDANAPAASPKAAELPATRAANNADKPSDQAADGPAALAIDISDEGGLQDLVTQLLYEEIVAYSPNAGLAVIPVGNRGSNGRLLELRIESGDEEVAVVPISNGSEDTYAALDRAAPLLMKRFEGQDYVAMERSEWPGRDRTVRLAGNTVEVVWRRNALELRGDGQTLAKKTSADYRDLMPVSVYSAVGIDATVVHLVPAEEIDSKFARGGLFVFLNGENAER